MVDRTVIALRCTVLVSRITRQRMDSDSEYQVYVVLQNWESTRDPTPIYSMSLRISRTKIIHQTPLKSTYIFLLIRSKPPGAP